MIKVTRKWGYSPVTKQRSSTKGEYWLLRLRGRKGVFRADTEGECWEKLMEMQGIYILPVDTLNWFVLPTTEKEL